MKDLKLIYVLNCCCFLISINEINAQSRFNGGLRFDYQAPIGMTKENQFQNAYGGAVDVFYDLTATQFIQQDLAIHLGLQIAFAGVVGQKDDFILDDPLDATARNSVYNSLTDLSINGRVYLLPYRRVSPYFEAMTGGRFLGTRERSRLLNSADYPDYEEITSEVLEGSNTFFLGLGTGVLTKINDCLMVDVGFNYRKGTAGDYIDMTSYNKINNDITYDVKNSITEHLGFYIGLRVNFDSYCGGDDSTQTRKRDSSKRNRSKNKKKTTKKSSTERSGEN